MITTGIVVLMTLLIILGWCLLLCGTIFWIWVLVDCVRHEPVWNEQKVIWILFIVLTHLIGACAYLAIRRPARRAEFGR